MSSLPASLLIDVNASERASSNAYTRSSPPTADQPRQGSALLSRLGLSGEYFPAVESANQIGGALDAELAQRCGRQARAVPLVANDDHAQVCAVCLGNMVRSGGVQPPLQDVAVDDQRPRQFPIALRPMTRPRRRVHAWPGRHRRPWKLPAPAGTGLYTLELATKLRKL
jgi:hypothetical protein